MASSSSPVVKTVTPSSAKIVPSSTARPYYEPLARLGAELYERYTDGELELVLGLADSRARTLAADLVARQGHGGS